MAGLASQIVKRAGLQAAFTAPSASDTFPPDDRTFYYAKVGATPTTFTFHVPATRLVHGDLVLKDLVVGPVTSHDEIIGPFPSEIYSDPTTGVATVTTDNQTAVTVGVFTLSS